MTHARLKACVLGRACALPWCHACHAEVLRAYSERLQPACCTYKCVMYGMRMTRGMCAYRCFLDVMLIMQKPGIFTGCRFLVQRSRMALQDEHTLAKVRVTCVTTHTCVCEFMCLHLCTWPHSRQGDLQSYSRILFCCTRRSGLTCLHGFC